MVDRPTICPWVADVADGRKVNVLPSGFTKIPDPALISLKDIEPALLIVISPTVGPALGFTVKAKSPVAFSCDIAKALPFVLGFIIAFALIVPDVGFMVRVLRFKFGGTDPAGGGYTLPFMVCTPVKAPPAAPSNAIVETLLIATYALPDTVVLPLMSKLGGAVKPFQ
jgi:hypothetical protein